MCAAAGGKRKGTQRTSLCKIDRGSGRLENAHIEKLDAGWPPSKSGGFGGGHSTSPAPLGEGVALPQAQKMERLQQNGKEWLPDTDRQLSIETSFEEACHWEKTGASST